MKGFWDLIVSACFRSRWSKVLTQIAASWWDHGRDLLFLINQFQDEIPNPIVGIGHSVGGSHL